MRSWIRIENILHIFRWTRKDKRTKGGQIQWQGTNVNGINEKHAKIEDNDAITMSGKSDRETKR